MSKIFIMSSVHFWYDNRIFYRQARSLVRQYQVEIHALGLSGVKNVEGITVVGLPKGRRTGRPLLWLRLLWRGLRSRAEFVHFHDPELIFIGLIIKYITNKQVIYDVHEDYSLTLRHKQWLPARFRLPIARIFGWMEKFMAGRLDAVVAATPAIAKNFTNTTIVSVCNFPPPDVIQPKVIKDYFHRDSTFTAAYIGVLSEARGIVDLLEALKLTRGVRLVLAGHFADSALERIVLEQAGRNDNLIYLGVLPPEEIPGLLDSVDAGLACLHPLPNHLSSLPLKMFEYMAAGLPVLVSSFPLWEDIVLGNGCGVTVQPGDCRAIAGALQKLAAAPDLCRRLGKNGRKAWAAQYNWVREEKKLLALYGNLGGIGYEPYQPHQASCFPIYPLNPRTCCQIILEQKTQLIPPVLIHFEPLVKREICLKETIRSGPGIVVIEGFISKTIVYKSLNCCTDDAEEVIVDEFPFQGVIQRDDANEGDVFVPDGMEVLALISGELNNYNKDGTLASELRERLVVNICVKKQVLMQAVHP